MSQGVVNVVQTRAKNFSFKKMSSGGFFQMAVIALKFVSRRYKMANIAKD
jgi:hypothetical protein